MAAPLFSVFIKLEERLAWSSVPAKSPRPKSIPCCKSGARITWSSPRSETRDPRISRSSAGSYGKSGNINRLDLAGALLAIAATSDFAVNHEVFTEAQRRGILCNAVDDPPKLRFLFSGRGAPRRSAGRDFNRGRKSGVRPKITPGAGKCARPASRRLARCYRPDSPRHSRRLSRFGST